MNVEIHITRTYYEGGKEGPKRLWVYQDGKVVSQHKAVSQWDVERIRKNYEASLNEPVRLLESY